MKYRKKPVAIEAIQIFANNQDQWPSTVKFTEQNGFEVYDNLHDTWVKFQGGDWVLTGVQGENYPCKAGVFLATYELVEE